MSDLARLFALDPLGMTKDDISAIVERMRQAQAQFELGIKTPVAERKRKNTKADVVESLASLDLLGDVDLKKLGLE